MTVLHQETSAEQWCHTSEPLSLVAQMAVALEQRKIRLMSNEHLREHYFHDYHQEPSTPLDPSPGFRQPLHLPDDSEAVLSLAESLAASKSTKLKMFAAVLYQTVFRCSPSTTQSISL